MMRRMGRRALQAKRTPYEEAMKKKLEFDIFKELKEYQCAVVKCAKKDSRHKIEGLGKIYSQTCIL